MFRAIRLAAPVLIGLSALTTALPAKAVPPVTLVPRINEVDTRGPLGGNDEFIELFNPLPVPLDISNWALRRCNSADTQHTSQIDLIDPVGGGLLGGDGRFHGAGATIAARGYLVIANTNAAGGFTGTWDFQYKTGITDHTGIQLVAPTPVGDVVVTRLGFSGVTVLPDAATAVLDTLGVTVPNDESVLPTRINACTSGMPAVNSGSNDSYSVSRITVDSGLPGVGCVTLSTGVNAADYRLRPRTPGGCNVPSALVPDPLGPFVKISEVATTGPGGGVPTGNDEFIEIHNNAPVPVDLSGYTLWRCNSADTRLVSNIELSAALPVVPAFGTIHVHHTGWTAPAGVPAAAATYTVGVSDQTGVRLHDGSGWRVDSIGFSGHPLTNSCTETAPATNPGAIPNNSVNRLIGGTPIAVDTNVNAVDFVTAAARTPGTF